MKLLDNKVAIVTGASQGIGAKSAKTLAKYGAKVVVNYLNSEQKANEVVKSITKLNGEAICIKADVTKENEVKNMVEKTLFMYKKIDILVINASIKFKMGGLLEFTWDEFENKLANEVKSAFYCTQAVLPSMCENKNGSIIFISSDLSKIQTDGFIAHATAKSAIDAFARNIAFEFAKYNIRVNLVAPGFTLSDANKNVPQEQKNFLASITPLKSLATPQDIANAVLMFSCEKTSFITGAYLPVNGGNLML